MLCVFQVIATTPMGNPTQSNTNSSPQKVQNTRPINKLYIK